MLNIQDLHVRYGGIHAVKGVNLNVSEGSIVTLIGANGAGKSSILRAICGLVKPSAGKITFDGKDITRIATDNIIKLGISLVPEGRRVFTNLTVTENLVLGGYTQKEKSQVQKDIDRVFGLFPRLKEREAQLAGTLSGGEQQMLAVGRALMSRPKLMMMDEPSLGLAPMLVKDVFKIIKEIREKEGVTILLIEQNARMALQVADYAYVLETGNITIQGSGSELTRNDAVKKAYLGE
jgi:branched-chain amino acid transport system ATP-binding protein